MALTPQQIREYIYNLGFKTEPVNPAFLKDVMPFLLDESGNSQVQLREVSGHESNVVNADDETSGARLIALTLQTLDGQPVFDLKEIDSIAAGIGITKLLPIIRQARALSSVPVEDAKKNLNPIQKNDLSTNSALPSDSQPTSSEPGQTQS